MRVKSWITSVGLVLGGALLASSTSAVAEVERNFTDVPNTHRFAVEIYTIAEVGIANGYDDGTFRPSQSVLREQMAAFLYRLAFLGEVDETEPPAVSPFADVPTTHRFYREIVWLAESGITTGYSDGTFRPSQPVLREQTAAFLCRFATGTLCKDLESDFPDEEEVQVTQEFADVPPSHTFFDAIWFMDFFEISLGYDEPNGTTTFRPSQPVLREQMAAFIVRFAINTSSGEASALMPEAYDLQP